MTGFIEGESRAQATLFPERHYAAKQDVHILQSNWHFLLVAVIQQRTKSPSTNNYNPSLCCERNRGRRRACLTDRGHYNN